MTSKRYAYPDPNRCVACGACLSECPQQAIKIWHGCYAIVDPNRCTGCGIANDVCPVNCISFKEREEMS